jgi:hypothetical protein
MYGMVNKALQSLITQEHGEEVWESIKKAAGVDVHHFVSNDGYPDEITYKLVTAASKLLNQESGELLFAFGRHWVLNTARLEYGHLLSSGGMDLKSFLLYLPNLHTRIKLIFPHLVPPHFTCTEVKESSLRLHYRSHREGLAWFVNGLLDGLGELYGTPVRVQHDAVRGIASDHDVFLVEWDTPAA